MIKVKMYLLYYRVIKNIRNGHKRIKHMNSFTDAMIQRKLRKFSKNALSEPQVSGVGSYA